MINAWLPLGGSSALARTLLVRSIEDMFCHVRFRTGRRAKGETK